MRHIDKQNDYESLEKQLLSLFHSGVYISSYDIASIGEKIGYKLPLKERDILLQRLMGEAKKDAKLKDLLKLFGALIEERVKKYKILGDEHPYAREVISSWLHKAKSTHLLLQRESARIADEN
ncbi:MAG: hypothetical protein JXQ68_03535 [Campylobacterales bacterium]|nr:hypothetical protein [Campylobacterales bacterium]